jgi:hypothetical protein
MFTMCCDNEMCVILCYKKEHMAHRQQTTQTENEKATKTNYTESKRRTRKQQEAKN